MTLLSEDYMTAFSVRKEAENLPWLAAYRQDAFDQFQKIGWPTRRHENWKYTNVSTISNSEFQFAEADTSLIKRDVLDHICFSQSDIHQLVFINGHYSARYSTIGELADNVSITSLRQALNDSPDLLKAIFNQCVCNERHVFAALNTALFNDGAFIYVPDNVVIEQPIAVHFIYSSNIKFSTVSRNLIILGQQAQANIIENYCGSEGTDNFTNTITEIETAAGAILQHYKVQRESSDSFHIGGTHLRQHRNSRVESYSVSLGGAIVRNDIEAQLVGEGAEITLNGLYFGKDRQHIDNHIWVNHIAPNTVSDENYRGVLDDHARGVFNGKVTVHQGAQKIKATQSNANLLLSDNSEIDTKPELEIYADDVQCSHGATVGQIDQDMLFYLRTRGINRDVARNLLIYAFIECSIRGIKISPLRARLRHNIIGSLSAGLDEVELIEGNC